MSIDAQHALADAIIYFGAFGAIFTISAFVILIADQIKRDLGF